MHTFGKPQRGNIGLRAEREQTQKRRGEIKLKAVEKTEEKARIAFLHRNSAFRHSPNNSWDRRHWMGGGPICFRL
jgi:hypothetical protein